MLLLLAAMISFLVPLLRSQPRLDHLVRNDFFSGFAGNREAFERGMQQAEQVLATEPNHAEALVWRGAGDRLPPPARATGAPLREDGISDYLEISDQQKDQLDQVGTHPRGELLFGLADAYSRNGNLEKAEHFFDLLLESLPNTAYNRRAAQWKETKQPRPLAQTNCVGCHTPGK